MTNSYLDLHALCVSTLHCLQTRYNEYRFASCQSSRAGDYTCESFVFVFANFKYAETTYQIDSRAPKPIFSQSSQHLFLWCLHQISSLDFVYIYFGYPRLENKLYKNVTKDTTFHSRLTVYTFREFSQRDEGRGKSVYKR